MIALTFYAGKPDPYTHNDIIRLSEWENRLGRAFNGFTRFDAIGNWQGETENCVVYEVLFSEVAFPTWQFMAKQAKLSLAECLGQQQVLVVYVNMGGLL